MSWIKSQNLASNSSDCFTLTYTYLKIGLLSPLLTSGFIDFSSNNLLIIYRKWYSSVCYSFTEKSNFNIDINKIHFFLWRKIKYKRRSKKRNHIGEHWLLLKHHTCYRHIGRWKPYCEYDSFELTYRKVSVNFSWLTIHLGRLSPLEGGAIPFTRVHTCEFIPPWIKSESLLFQVCWQEVRVLT